MPKPSLRTRSKRRRELRLPGGRTTTHQKKEKPGVPRCARCSNALSGVPHMVSAKLRKLPASQKKIRRMYGGHLCHNCLQNLLKQAAKDTQRS